MVSRRGVWGTSPRKLLDLRAASGAFQWFLGHFTQMLIPLTPKKFLFRFTLISRMVLGVGKSLKSDLRLKILSLVICVCNQESYVYNCGAVVDQFLISFILQATVLLMV